MSNAVKSVGKFFKKVFKNKVFRVVAIAAAALFTGGLALGAFGATGLAASISATLSGIPLVGGAAAGALGAGTSAGIALSAGMSTVFQTVGEALGIGGSGAATGVAAETPLMIAPGMESAALTESGLINEAASGALASGGEGAAGSALVTEPAGASVASAAPGPATAATGSVNPALISTPPAGNTGIINQAMNWISGVDPATGSVNAGAALARGTMLASAGNAAVGAIGARNAAEEQAKEREERRRLSKVPDLSGMWKPYQRPGLINDAMGGK